MEEYLQAIDTTSGAYYYDNVPSHVVEEILDAWEKMAVKITMHIFSPRNPDGGLAVYTITVQVQGVLPQPIEEA